MKFLTFCYLATFNFWLLLCPVTLSHDWQMGSVPLVTSLADTRNLGTFLFFVCCLIIAYRGLADFEEGLFHSDNNNKPSEPQHRPEVDYSRRKMSKGGGGGGYNQRVGDPMPPSSENKTS
uniref:DUF1736 domain-containing protein n=1 Tax=Timema shepardi TaxID=629360 RepID=A0A7R9AZS1_TIMSH|nr:unnamed protein product [Timema shepardi]